MNKSSLKTFAIWGRNELREKVKIKLEILGIDEKGITEGDINNNLVSINGFEYSKGQYDSLIRKYNDLGYNELVEEVAYTWFNRLTALAYMEINEYSDDRLIYSTTSKVEPDIMDNYMEAEFFEELSQDRKNTIHDLKDTHKLEEMYSILIEEKCHELSKIMPFMFEKSSDYTELLFPSGLLLEDSFLVKLREEIKGSIEEIDGEKRVPVELIGWLYQYYITENNELVYDGNMKKAKIPKELLPAATQLFTPDWVVKYMAENSLGKLGVESLGVSEGLKKKWKYYIDPVENEELKVESEKIAIEDVKILDPAMGSGHMLTYSFDLLFEIYEDLGWSRKEAVLSILRNNIYGLEIDDRAGMLASFAIIMKAREKFKRLFRILERLKEEEKFDLNTLAIQESNSIGEQTLKLIGDNNFENLRKLIHTFEDAKEYGSILKLGTIDNVQLTIEKDKLKEKYQTQGQIGLFGGTWNFKEDIILINRLMHQARVMDQKYDITITNPPYLGASRFNGKLSNYVKKNYPEVKSDLCMIFYEKAMDDFTKKEGFISFITTNSWLFLKSFENIRKRAIRELEFESLVDFGSELFDGKVGHNLIVAWVNKNIKPTKKMKAIRLVEFCYSRRAEKVIEFFNTKNHYLANQKDFFKIPGSPIAYWVSSCFADKFAGVKVNDIADTRLGMATADNGKFLRLWNEVSLEKVGFGVSNREDANNSGLKWFPYQKGGDSRKWYGNYDYLVNWENDGLEIQNFINPQTGKVRSHNYNLEYIFKTGITWNALSSGNTSMRLSQNSLFDNAGSSMFLKNMNDLNYCLAIFNSQIVPLAIKAISSTMNYQPGDIAKLPIVFQEKITTKQKIEQITQNCIDIAKQEWDSRETSWDFTKNQLLINNYELLIEKSVEKYESYWREQFFQMHSNEEELNRLFIEIYELQDEMDEKVDLKDITLLKKETNLEEIHNEQCTIDNENLSEAEIEQGKKLVFNRNELVKQFLSYAVGCIMGRYSIDKKGLIIANSDDELVVENGKLRVENISGEVRHTIDNPIFTPDAFGVIPVTNERVFENDIVTRIEEFVSAVYGSENLNENLEFIATHLGKKESEKVSECIRRYFLKDFYSDHVSRYSKPGKKAPIYWIVNSGKKEGFSALIYMHRYRDNTIGRVRTDYLNRYQEVLENIFNSNSRRLEDEDLKPKEKKVIEKEIKVINGQIDELKKFALDVKDIADKKISIDLDDGVKINYAKFGKILKKI